MKHYPIKVQRYIKTVTVSAIILLIYLAVNTVNYNLIEFKGLIFFGVVAIITNSIPVSLPRGGNIAVTFAVIYACMLLFGPGITVFVGIIGEVISRFSSPQDNPWYKVMFNCAQVTLAAGISGLIYQFTGGEIWDISLINIFPLFISVLTFFIINTTAVSMILAFIQNTSPLGIWIINYRWMIPNYVTLAPIGFLMAYVYKAYGPLAVSLFFVPLLLARFIFKSYMEMREVYLDTLAALVDAMDAKDSYTRGHSERVAVYAVEIAREMKLPEDQVEVIQHMALLHDVGKIGIHDEILNKPGQLENGEFDQVKKHSEIGARIINEISDLGHAKEYILYHHEKYNGTGYPAGLRGNQIPLGARIITVADCFDAMTSNRSYRDALSLGQAVLELKMCSSSQFDPKIVDVFVRVLERENAPAPLAAVKTTEALHIK